MKTSGNASKRLTACPGNGRRHHKGDTMHLWRCGCSSCLVNWQDAGKDGAGRADASGKLLRIQETLGWSRPPLPGTGAVRQEILMISRLSAPEPSALWAAGSPEIGGRLHPSVSKYPAQCFPEAYARPAPSFPAVFWLALQNHAKCDTLSKNIRFAQINMIVTDRNFLYSALA